MIGDPYSFSTKDYIATTDTMFFTFLSVGSKGTILKAIAYTPIEKDGKEYYNFGFGDLLDDQATGELRIDDKAESNNGDVKKVFYTVVSTLEDFFDRYPDAIVHIEGSTRQRMDVYQGLITRHAKQIEHKYLIQGFKDNRPDLFQSGERYEYILISRKKSLNLEMLMMTAV